MVTPLRDHDDLDVSGLERLIEHLLEGGVAGLFILGTTGEAPSLSYRLRRELIERTCRQVNGRVPVLVGITDTVFVESVRLAQHAVERGVVVCTAPALDLRDLGLEHREKTPQRPADAETLAEHERSFLTGVLEQAGWVIRGPQGAARRLGLNESTLRSRMKKLGIRRPGPAERGRAPG